MLCLLSLLWTPCAAGAGTVVGRAVDADTGTPLPVVLISFQHQLHEIRRQTATDTSGAFRLELAPGPWELEAWLIGYRPGRREVVVGADLVAVDLRLEPEPLQMDAMVVRARRVGTAERTPAFVEVIAIRGDAPGADLPALLDEAVGVSIRRYGGLGSFSTVSIRGSTAEQVLVFLDGVPLNQAVGGGVDLGNLPVGGIESIEVYRGSVPARFGGNSLGGVVHIRTRAAQGIPQSRLQVQTGSFGTRQLGLTTGAAWRQWQWLALVDYSGSDNDFPFLDDNGTEYTEADDEWADRANSDFQSLRILTKASRSWGRAELLMHSTVDFSNQGIPGIGNFQSLHTRYDTRRVVTEAELYGPFAEGLMGYRLSLHDVVQAAEFKDLRGEVGIGKQHERNTTHAMAARGELSSVLPGQSLATAFAQVRRERFDPESMVARGTHMEASRRHGASLGFEVEVPLFDDRAQLMGGGQVEVLDDSFAGVPQFHFSSVSSRRHHTETLWGARIGGKVRLAGGWHLQGHRGWYQRAPSFYELFGDRGAVMGNSELLSENGVNWDAGLVYRGADAPTALLLAELVYYRNSVDDLIRFIQNSQRVSRPHNIGEARLQGVEARAQVRLASVVQTNLSYAYQEAENRSPFPYENGRDLPNAPRHVLGGRVAVSGGELSVHYELHHESRHFLDRANLRRVPRRTVHTIGGGFPLGGGTRLAWEVRNATDNQVADLWGYPLPGRAFFVSLQQDLLALFR